MDLLLTEINRINSQELETLIACLLAILSRAVDLIARYSFDEPKLGSQKYLVTLPGTLEPLTQKFLTVSIEATILIRRFLLLKLDRNLLRTIPEYVPQLRCMIKDCKSFFISRDSSVNFLRHSHQAKINRWYTWAILAQLVA
jgi:hypothetical protein